MKQYPNVKLHAKYTDLSFWAGILLFPPIFFIIFFIAFTGEWNLKAIIVTILLVALAAVTIYLYAILCKAEIIDNKLHVKKYFGSKEVYDLTDLKAVKAYNFTNAKHIQLSEQGLKARKDIYIFFTMEKNGNKKKYLIIGYNFFMGDESFDAEKLLKEVLEENQKTTV